MIKKLKVRFTFKACENENIRARQIEARLCFD